MLVVFSLITFLFIITISWFILSINHYDFDNNYNIYKQSNIVNKSNINLWKQYIKYYNNWSWNNLYCFSWNTKEDNNCYYRWYYWFIPPKKNINLWNFFISKDTSFIASWTNNLEFVIENWNIKNKYNINNTLETKIFEKWYYNLYTENKNNTWEQFFITTKDDEGFKNIDIKEISYNCNCYDSWNNLVLTWIKNNCQLLWSCTNTWDYIITWTIYSWKVLLKTNLNYYQDNNKQFKKLFYLTWN